MFKKSKKKVVDEAQDIVVSDESLQSEQISPDTTEIEDVKFEENADIITDEAPAEANETEERAKSKRKPKKEKKKRVKRSSKKVPSDEDLYEDSSAAVTDAVNTIDEESDTIDKELDSSDSIENLDSEEENDKESKKKKKKKSKKNLSQEEGNEETQNGKKSKKKRKKKQPKKFNPNKKRFGIKLKLLLTVLPTVSIAVLVLLIITYSSSEKIILDLAKKNLTADSKAYAQEFSVWANSIISELEMYRTTIESVDMSLEERYAFLQKTLNRNESYPDGIYMGSSENAYVSATKMEEKSSFAVASQKWYQSGLRNRKFSFGEPLYNESSDSFYCTASCTILDPQGVMWIGGADISLEYISEKVAGIEIMDAGTSFLYDMRSATIIAHPDSSFISCTLDQEGFDSLYENIRMELYEIGYGLRETTGDAGNYMVDIQPVDGSNFLLITFIEEETVLHDLNSLRTLVMILMIIGIILIGVLTERMVHIIIKPIKYLTRALSKITAGDFSDDLKISGNDEVSVMTYSMQHFIETMRGTISDINMVSLELSNQAEESSEIAETIRYSATKQADSMNSLNVTIEELVNSISEITDNALSLAEVVMDTRNNGLQVNNIMNDTVAISEQGKYDMEQVTLSMDKIKETVHTLVDSIERVSTSTGQINKMVGMITDISDETNLLSINAAIEASRAGDAGKGFAVVANQIRHLADISANAALDITKLTEYINELICEVKSQAEISSKEILDSGSKIATASATFNNIYESISASSGIVTEMLDKINTADGVATSVAGITEEQAAGATEIHQTTVSLLELANNVAEDSSLVAEMAHKLTYTADDLSDQVNNFKIEKEGECVEDIAHELLS